MNRNSNQRNNQRNRKSQQSKNANDIWRATGAIPEVEPIPAPREPSALLASLGDPPMINGAHATAYFSAVVERAAAIATALALSVDLLDDPR